MGTMGGAKGQNGGFSPPLRHSATFESHETKQPLFPGQTVARLGKAKLQGEQERLLCGLGLHAVILYVEANCPFNYCAGCTEIEAHSLSHWQQPGWPRCSD